jgi:hypothetical protein
LDARRNEISSLPSTVNELKHLMCLRIDSWTKAANEIGSFTSLEELSTLCIQDSTDIIEQLGNLTELRERRRGGEISSGVPAQAGKNTDIIYLNGW